MRQSDTRPSPAQENRNQHSYTTRSDTIAVALAAAKARGIRLGNPQLCAGTPEEARAAAAAKSRRARARAVDVVPYIEAARRAGACTLARLAEALTNRGVPTPAGKGA